MSPPECCLISTGSQPQATTPFKHPLVVLHGIFREDHSPNDFWAQVLLGEAPLGPSLKNMVLFRSQLPCNCPVNRLSVVARP